MEHSNEKNSDLPALTALTDQDIISHFRQPTSLRAQKKSGIHFRGVLANDEFVGKEPKQNHIYILNLQNENEPGSHWVMFYKTHYNGLYIDSYGVPPTQSIQPFVTEYNSLEFQGFNKQSCGYYAIYFADQIIKKKDPFEGLKHLSYEDNERFLKRYFN